MAVENNGKALGPGQRGANGHANGHAVVPRSKTVKKQKGFGLFSIISRYLALLRCSNEVTDVFQIAHMVLHNHDTLPLSRDG
jgi:hypothetical protein